MTRPAKHCLELHNVSKHYAINNQVVVALTAISLRIVRGSRVVIMGKSGAGKSTLLQVIGTLERPTSGNLQIETTDVASMDDETVSLFRNATIGFVFQANNLLPEFTALENVMMPGLIAGAGYRRVANKAKQVLQRVGLQDRQRHRPSELSGGEQQRVAIARALIMTPSLILADEPTGNLDRNNGIMVRDLLFNLCEEYKATMLLVTHDRDLASCFSQHLLMEDGSIIEQNL